METKLALKAKKGPQQVSKLKPQQPLMLLVLLIAMAHGQASSRFTKLFQQLQSSETSTKATKQWLKLGKSDTRAREYIAKHLPHLMETSTNPEVLGNVVRLAGQLKIAEAAPALTKWISVDNVGTITLSGMMKLENNPAGKALSQIGDPAIPALRGVLGHGNLRERQNAVSVLRVIGSEHARNALRAHLTHESDPELRGGIEKILAK